jgi:hypothetical protein
MIRQRQPRTPQFHHLQSAHAGHHSFSNATSFRKTGLIPFNPEIILERLQEYNAEREPGRGNRCTPSPLPSAQPITTPHITHSLKRHADAVIAEVFERTDPEFPTGKWFRETIQKFAKGSLAQAELGTIAEEELLRTKATDHEPTDRTDLDDL